MIKAIILDRDGVINELVERSGQQVSPRVFADFKIRPDFVQFYERIDTTVIKLFVASSQPDIERGLMEPAELQQMTSFLASKFSFTEILYCLHDDHSNCQCRKPKPGMPLQILSRHDLKASEVVLIGDTWKDILAGQGADIVSYYLSKEKKSPDFCTPDFIVADLMEFLQLLELR